MNAARLHVVLPDALERFRPAAAPRRGLRFGIAALDGLLGGGIPRGQITVCEAPLGSGGTALLLALAEATLRADEGVAFVDARRTLAPQSAAHLAIHGRFWVVRPRGTESAWWCADVLLRTGAFGLVIVDLAPVPTRKIAVRLQRLAADKSSALVARDAGAGAAAAARGAVADRLADYCAALRLAVAPGDEAFVPGAPGGCAWPGPRAVRVRIVKGGAQRAAEVSVGSSLPHRLRPHWAVRDRRGGARGRASLSGRGQRRRVAQSAWPD